VDVSPTVVPNLPPSGDIAAVQWAKTVKSIGMLAVLLIGIGFCFKQCAEAPSKVMKEGREWTKAVALLAEKAVNGTITTEIRESGVSVSGCLQLQVATFSCTEEVTRTDSKSLDLYLTSINLPEVTAQIKVPVEYTYFCDLRGNWSFTFDNEKRVMDVVAPPVQANTPAPDLSRMEANLEKSLLRFGEESTLETLRRGLTRDLTTRAMKHVPLVQDKAEKAIKLFVETWLARNYFDGAVALPFSLNVRFDAATVPENLSPPLADKKQP
jgi:hypothetical protein